MTDPDFTSPIAGRIEVREPCPWCADRPMIPRPQMDEHVARLHPEVQTVESSATPAGQAPATDRIGLRDRIAAALYERERPPRDPHWPDVYASDREVFEAMADAVLAVLPASVDRAEWDALASETDRLRTAWGEMRDRAEQIEAEVQRLGADRAAVLSDAERTMLTYALDQAQERIWSEGGFTDEDQAAVTSLRRLAAAPAAGAQQCEHSFPDPYPHGTSDHPGPCRYCDISYQEALRRQVNKQQPKEA
jgi:hypothetical protein